MSQGMDLPGLAQAGHSLKAFLAMAGNGLLIPLTVAVEVGTSRTKVARIGTHLQMVRVVKALLTGISGITRGKKQDGMKMETLSPLTRRIQGKVRHFQLFLRPIQKPQPQRRQLVFLFGFYGVVCGCLS